MGYSVRACLKKKERKGRREGRRQGGGGERGRFKNKQKSSFHIFTETRFPYKRMSIGESGAQTMFTIHGSLTQQDALCRQINYSQPVVLLENVIEHQRTTRKGKSF